MPGTKTLSKAGGKVTAGCAFCNGTGKDPFELLSKLSSCQTCRGRGEVTIAQPAIECAFCGGTGIHRDQRLTCTVCGGKGMVTAPKDSTACPDCGGKGVTAGDYLPCSRCAGRGVVVKEKPRKKAGRKKKPK